jgi:hypothetical protein
LMTVCLDQITKARDLCRWLSWWTSQLFTWPGGPSASNAASYLIATNINIRLAVIPPMPTVAFNWS